MGAIGLNPIRLDRIGLDPIRINAIKLGVPGAASGTNRPYIDPEVLASLKAVCICYGKSNDDPDRAVVKNLVDPDNPFVISNASYKLNSGYGKYEVDFTDSSWNSDTIFKQSNKITFTLSNNVNWKLWKHSNQYTIEKCKVVVSGINNGDVVNYNYYNGTTYNTITLVNGVNEIPKSELDTNRDAYIGFSKNSKSDSIIIIEQIPSFQGAFVTDGIDDLITSTKTVQEMLGGSNELTIVSMVHQVKDSANNVSFTNYIRGSANGYFRNIVNNYDKTGIYGYTSSDLKDLSVVNNILGDKNDYTSNGDNRDSIINGNFSVQGYSYNDGNNTGDFSSVAWYWTIIANKVLTTDQINQVIAYFNLDRTLKPDILCDVKKQGITNENHAEFGDRLIDFSGNGRDIQLNNIAWKGDSGIGKYEVDFLDSSIWNSSNSTITSSKIDCKNAISHIMLLYYSVGSKEYPDIPSFKVIKTGADIDYSYIDETGSPKSVRIVDGVNVLPASHNTLYSGSGRFCGFGNPGMGNSVTITQIPSHAGALCLDGVDDFGINKDVPTFTDFTVIAKRTWLEENTSDKPFIIKGDSLYPDGNQNAFLFEYGKLSTYSFGQNNKYDESVVPSLISYATTYSYNGVIPLVRGSATDTIGIDVAHSTKIALYFLMLFPYSMSEFLIERQLKKHKLGTLYPDMVEFRPIVKSNLPYSSISYSVNPGEYISVDSMVTITVTLPNTSDKLMEVSCNAISDISISGDNGVYEITGKIVKSPQKINLVISSYLTMLNNETLISNETLIKNE